MPPKKRATGTTGEAIRAFYTTWAADEGLELDVTDLALLERLAKATDLAARIEAQIDADGPMLTTERGTSKPHPGLPALRGEVELAAKLTVLLDKRIEDAAAGDDAVNRGGVRPFETRGQYRTGTDDTPAAVRRPARTPRTKRR